MIRQPKIALFQGVSATLEGLFQVEDPPLLPLNLVAALPYFPFGGGPGLDRLLLGFQEEGRLLPLRLLSNLPNLGFGLTQPSPNRSASGLDSHRSPNTQGRKDGK